MDTIVLRGGVEVRVHGGTAYGGAAQKRAYKPTVAPAPVATVDEPPVSRRRRKSPVSKGGLQAVFVRSGVAGEPTSFDQKRIQWVLYPKPKVHRMYRAKLQAALRDQTVVSPIDRGLYAEFAKHLAGEELTIPFTVVASGVVHRAKKTLGTFIQLELEGGEKVALPVGFLEIFKSCLCSAKAR